MPEPLYKVGEARGPFTVVSDEFTFLSDDRTVEHVVDSGRNEARMYVKWGDTSYHYMCSRKRGYQILVPYTRKDPRTVDALKDRLAIWVDVSGSNWDYWRVLCDWWVPTDDLIIIEHDIAPRPDIFDSFERCPEPWCLFVYGNHSYEDALAWKFALGCTRFRKEIIEAVPDALMNVQERWRDWHYTCDGIGYNLTQAGFAPHLHFQEAPVEHHRFLDENGIRPDHKEINPRS